MLRMERRKKTIGLTGQCTCFMSHRRQKSLFLFNLFLFSSSTLAPYSAAMYPRSQASLPLSGPSFNGYFPLPSRNPPTSSCINCQSNRMTCSSVRPCVPCCLAGVPCYERQPTRQNSEIDRLPHAPSPDAARQQEARLNTSVEAFLYRDREENAFEVLPNGRSVLR